MATPKEDKNKIDATPWLEIGSLGLEINYGFVQEAYNSSLFWPHVYPLYNRIRRSDPEIVIVRNGYTSLARGVQIDWELPENPTDDDKRARDFADQVIKDIDGGFPRFLEAMVSYVPFMGWGWWELVPGRRRNGWVVDGWQSEYDDGLIGFRKFGFRDHSTLERWKSDDKTGKILGMIQHDYPNPQVTIPSNKSLHLTYGDPENPEGLSPLEAVWRLERIKYGLEVVQGIGFEHAAGYLSVDVEQNPITEESMTAIRTAAANIAAAQQGNYAAWPKDVTGAMTDVPFTAAPSMLEAIKYYGILKLTVYNMQWVALSATTGAGSYSAMEDSSSMYVLGWNSMMGGWADQITQQVIKRLFKYPANKNAFPNMTRIPKMIFKPIEKTVSLADLSSFVSSISGYVPLGKKDMIEIRRKSGILSEDLPEPGEEVAPPSLFPSIPASPEFSEFAAAGEADITGIKADYENDIDAAIQGYVEDGDRDKFSDAMKAAIVLAFLLTLQKSYAAAGAGEPDRVALSWIKARQQLEIGFITSIMDAVDAERDVSQVPSNYARTLNNIANEAAMRALPNLMLTFAGLDGKENCRTCKGLKGRRKPAKWWVKNDLVPGRPGNDKFDCKGYRCQHGLFKDDGQKFTI